MDDLEATLDRLERRLRDLQQELAAAPRAEGDVWSQDLALEARTDLPGLCALARALDAVAAVHAVDLRAYAGGHAVLDVALDRPVALVRALRDAGGPPVAVLETRPGRLALEVHARS